MSGTDAPTSSSSARGVVHRVGLALAALLLILTPIAGRVWVDGASALREAEAAASVGDAGGELRWLGRAARYRMPVATHDDRARARMVELAEAATSAGNDGEALGCWREVRRATLATRVFAIDDPELVERANNEIVALMTRQAEAFGQPVESERWAAELEEDLPPRTRSLAAALCFALFMAACLGFFVLAIDERGRLEPRRATRTGALVLVTLIAWISLM